VNLSDSLHQLAGHSQSVDSLIRVAASQLPYAAVFVLLALWWLPGGLRAVIAAAGGAVLGLALGQLLGAVWNEPRPFVAEGYVPLIAHGADSGFPSDHLIVLGALTAAAFGASRLLGGLSLALALIVAVGRVAAGVHWIGDVAAGAVLGALCALLVLELVAKRLAGPALTSLDGHLQRRRLRPSRPVS
jgi:undecaprenyl-diphosphatase